MFLSLNACLEIRIMILRLYACLLTIDTCMFIFTIDIEHICFVYAKGKKYSSLMHVCVEHSLYIFMFIAMHELTGVSMKLNFNPCIYNSMSFVIIKKGEIVGPEARRSSFDNDSVSYTHLTLPTKRIV